MRKEAISLDEVLTGTIFVTSEEEFDAHEIRVEVRGTALGAIPDSSGASDALLWWIIERVSGPLHFTSGYSQEFPFNVTIPRSPGKRRYGRPWSGGILRMMGGLPFRLWVEREGWLQRDPKRWRKLRWTVKGVIAVKKRRDASSKPVRFRVRL